MITENLQLKPKFFWVGPMIPSAYLNTWTAASPAAMKWQKHLVDALVKEGADLEWLYYRPDPYWPKGRLLPWQKLLIPDIIYKNRQISYVNLPIYRNLSIKNSFRKILKDIIKSRDARPLIVISYNAPSWMEDIFSDHNIRSQFICTYLIADNVAPKGADGYAFLSYDSFQRYLFSNKKIHLDGAVYPKVKRPLLQKTTDPKRKTIFLYSGSLGKWGGVKILLDSMTLIKRNDFELWISGFGYSTDFKKSLLKDKRIKFLGLLSDDQLHDAYQAANVFLNPRPVNMPGNENNFPSKIFDYLAWKKPIISTLTKSLSPEYREILHITEDNPFAFSSAMSSYIGIEQEDMNKHEKWFKEKTWKKQAISLLSFLEKICHSTNRLIK